MKVAIRVLLQDDIDLPETAICRVEIQDVTLLDAESITVELHEAQVVRQSEHVVSSVVLDVPPEALASRDLCIHAHLSLDGDEGVQAEDYVTTQAYPLGQQDSDKFIDVELRPARG